MLLSFNTFFQLPNSVFAEIGLLFSLKTNCELFSIVDNKQTILSGKSTFLIEFNVLGVLYIVCNVLFPLSSNIYTFFTVSLTSIYFFYK